MKNIILTGDRPTGRLHIGHYVGSLKRRVKLQEEGNYDEFYIMIADSQALTDNFDNPDKVRRNVIEVMLDYLAVGLDPNKVTFFIQSEVSALTELTYYYMNLVTIARLFRNPTVKSELNDKKFKDSIPVGFAAYPISQAADITAFKANIIPVGDDQEPMIEQTREIVRSFNRIYKTDVLKECVAVLPEELIERRLVGTDGNTKMSKSLNNCIYLSDEKETIKEKVFSIKTTSRKIEDPGTLKDNILFIYLDVFCTDDHFQKYYPEFKNLKELKEAYQKGGIGDITIKKFLTEVINDELTPIRERRKKYANNIEYVYEVLKEGTKKASIFADKTIKEVKEAMKLNYFSDSNYLIQLLNEIK